MSSLKILEILKKNKECCMIDFVSVLDLSPVTVRKNLKWLIKQDVVDFERRFNGMGNHKVFYFLK